MLLKREIAAPRATRLRSEAVEGHGVIEHPGEVALITPIPILMVDPGGKRSMLRATNQMNIFPKDLTQEEDQEGIQALANETVRYKMAGSQGLVFCVLTQ